MKITCEKHNMDLCFDWPNAWVNWTLIHTHTYNSMVMFEVFYFCDDDSLELVYKLSMFQIRICAAHSQVNFLHLVMHMFFSFSLQFALI